MKRTFYIVTLGCPKNRVDAEVIWADMAKYGLVAVEEPSLAEVIIVNSCAFIESAVSESLDTIMEMSRYRKEGSCRKLVVAGCLTPRYQKKLLESLPEVDLFTGPAEVGKLAELITQDLPAGQLECECG